MKKQHIITLLAVVLTLCSCGDFFEESSQSDVKPTTVEDMAAVLYSTAYPYNTDVDNYLILLTDEVQCNGKNSDSYIERLRAGRPVFTFTPEMFDGYESFIDDENSWKTYYKLIMGCNVVLDNADQMTGTDEKKAELKGQARLLRAYYYLRLAMVYCQPFSNNPDTNLGLTLITTSDVSDVQPKRATLRQTYDFIEQEMLGAAEDLQTYKPTTKYRVTTEAAYIMLSRLYLYEEQWDKAIDYATRAIKGGDGLTELSGLTGTDNNVYDASASREVVWNYGGKVYASTYIGATNLYYGVLPYSLADQKLALYDQTNDLRYQKFLNVSAWTGNYVQKVSINSQHDGEHGVRLAEAYVTRAEAYARKAVAGDASAVSSALADLNTLRRARYATGTYEDVTISDAQELLQFTLDEREREFLWEDGLRWMDIKRLGLSVTHTYIDEDGNQTVCNLPAGSPLYALPIPHDAISRNPNLQQNPR